MPAAVEVEELTVRYGDLVAVDRVSFAAEAGEVTVVLGPNGAGKTSTIEACEGYIVPTSGSVRILGLDPARQQAQLSERMGVMLQQGGISPGARVAETVAHYCALYARGADADALIDLVDLRARARTAHRRLSGGEQQRLSLALALAARPDVAFLDEPTSGVDVHGRETIRAIVRDLAGGGCAVVLATHEMDEAERIADRVVIFDQARVVADAPLDELRAGHDEIRFRSSDWIDVADLAVALGTPVTVEADGEYRVGAAPDPRIMATLAVWLNEHGHPLWDVRAGAEKLEDVFRRLTGASRPRTGGDR